MGISHCKFFALPIEGRCWLFAIGTSTITGKSHTTHNALIPHLLNLHIAEKRSVLISDFFKQWMP